MAAGKHTYLIEQGADFIEVIEYLNPPVDPINAPLTPGPPIDITGWDARMQIREGSVPPGGTLIADLTTGGGEITLPGPLLGQFQVRITTALTTLMTATQFASGAVYDFEAIDTPGSIGPAGAVYRLLQGGVKFSENVTLP